MAKEHHRDRLHHEPGSMLIFPDYNKDMPDVFIETNIARGCCDQRENSGPAAEKLLFTDGNSIF